MLLTCYLASAALFYIFVVKRAPVVEEPAFVQATQLLPCEVVELFSATADQTDRKAA